MGKVIDLLKRVFLGQEQYVWDRLNWGVLKEFNGKRNLVVNLDGSLGIVAAITPPNQVGATNNQRLAVSVLFHAAMLEMGDNWSFWDIENRRERTRYEASEIENMAGRFFEAERQWQFMQPGLHHQSDHFVAFQYKPTQNVVNAITKFLIHGDDDAAETTFWQQVGSFMDDCRRLLGLLEDFRVRVLDGDELRTVLKMQISGKTHEVADYDWDEWASPFLCDQPYVFGTRPYRGWNDEDPHLQHFRVINVTGFAKWTRPGILDGLDGRELGLSERAIVFDRVTRWLPMGSKRANKELGRTLTKANMTTKGALRTAMEAFSPQVAATAGGVNRASAHLARDADKALDELAGSDVVRGYMTSTITVYHRDRATCVRQAQEIEQFINKRRITCHIEGHSFNSSKAFLGSRVFDVAHDPTRPMVNSMVAATMVPMTAPPRGIAYNKHLKSRNLIDVTTAGNNVYHLDLHWEGDLGHFLVGGWSGGGKSTLLNALCLAWMRYKGWQIVRTDIGNSALVQTLAAGGRHFDPTRPGNYIQPLRWIDSRAGFVFAFHFIVGILMSEDPVAGASAATKRNVMRALRTMRGAFPVNKWTMTAFCGVVVDPAISAALKAFTSQGIYPFFDGVLGDDAFDVDYLTFEIGGLIKQPTALNPLCAYMSFIGDRKASPDRPLLELYDEAHAVMMPPFDKRINERLRTARRDNITVGFASQNLEDFNKSSIASALLDNCPNRFIIPDPELISNAAVPILRGFQFSDGHIRRIAAARPNRQYAFQRKGGDFAIIGLELMEMGLALCTTTNSYWVGVANDTLAIYGQEHFLYGFLLKASRTWPGLRDALQYLPEPPDHMTAASTFSEPLMLAAE